MAMGCMIANVDSVKLYVPRRDEQVFLVEQVKCHVEVG